MLFFVFFPGFKEKSSQVNREISMSQSLSPKFTKEKIVSGII